MSEKTEKASPYKLQKAKEKGQVSKSIELNIAILLAVMLVVGTALWPALIIHLKKLMISLLNQSVQMPFSMDNINKLQQFLLSSLITLWLPFALAALVCIVLSTVAQTGFVWSTQPLSPDMKRLNIVTGFKRLFSSKLVFEAAKSSLKLGLAFLIISLSLHHETPNLIQLIASSPSNHPALIMHLLTKLTIQLLLLLLAVAILDKIYTQWKYKKDNRMSKQEVKDEHRQREGDPKIKAKLRQLQQSLRQKTNSLTQVKTADVVVTNPNHLAVALKYDRGIMPAPKVVCKAQGEFATQVKALAKQYRIPIIQNIAFARALFASVEPNQWINQEHYPLAAIIFREVYRQREASSC